MSIYKKRAIENFYSKDFRSAFFNISFALQENPDDSLLQLMSFLTKIAEEHPDKVFDFFDNSLNANIDFDSVILSLDSIFDDYFDESSLLHNDLDIFLLEEDGLIYDDFLDIVKKVGDFKSVFENVMFSTKILISNKEDFIDFVNMLIDNGFIEISLNYIEHMLPIFFIDDRLNALIKKAQISEIK